MFGSITSWFIWRMTFKINEKKTHLTHTWICRSLPPIFIHTQKDIHKRKDTLVRTQMARFKHEEDTVCVTNWNSNFNNNVANDHF